MTSPVSPLRARLARSLLYLVTPPHPEAGPLEEFLPAVIGAGVDIVQLRDKEMEGGPLLRHAMTVRELTAAAGALFIVNDRVDLAIACGADGVHVGQDDIPVEEARRQLGREALIGLSTHTAGQVRAASETDADYIAVGPVYATPTKPGRPAAGHGPIAEAVRSLTRPFFAIGGIDASTLPGVVEAGARRVAVLRALTRASDPAAEAGRLRALLEAAREHSPK